MVPPCVKRFRQRGKPNHRHGALVSKKKKGRQQPTTNSSSSSGSTTVNDNDNDVPLPRKLTPYERFFASLLRSSAKDYLKASPSPECNNEQEPLVLWYTICRRLKLPLLVPEQNHPIESRYFDQNEHFDVRASLVLEESRHAISEGLAKRWGSSATVTTTTTTTTGTSSSSSSKIQRRRQAGRKKLVSSRTTMKVKCISLRTNQETNHSTVKFQLVASSSCSSSYYGRKNQEENHHHQQQQQQQQRRFTKEQLFHLRPGTVVEILPCGIPNSDSDNTKNQHNRQQQQQQQQHQQRRSIDQVLLGCILPGGGSSSRDEMERESSFSVMIFRSYQPTNNNDQQQQQTLPFKEQQQQQQELFEITPVAGLISELRQFEACTSRKTKEIPFLMALMGHWPKHTRFHYSDDKEGVVVDDEEEAKAIRNEVDDDADSITKEEGEVKKRDNHDDDGDHRDVIDEIFEGLDCVSSEDEAEEEDQAEEGPWDDVAKEDDEVTKSSSNDDDDDNEDDDDEDRTDASGSTGCMMTVPQLNKTQEQVASQFLSSTPGTITICQGPPGTGKSFLLVSVICRYLLTSSSPPRLLVSAPTNKAVTVVATRFLRALNNGMDYDDRHNVIMVGDVEKLLEPTTTAASPSDAAVNVGTFNCSKKELPSLRSIFVYTWLECVIEQYQRLRQLSMMIQNQSSFNEMQQLAQRLHRMLLRQLPVSTKGELASLSRKVMKDLKNQQNASWRDVDDDAGMGLQQQQQQQQDVSDHLDDLINTLQDLPNDDVCQELLNTANVIFCTLASAGASIFKRTPRVDDLIVDEAAAATEPLLYIPFHLRPRRLLIVGDPQQLPATVMSNRAVTLGYNKSLHERLMQDCQCPYTMLDVQYRMRPEISSFPSSMFYQGKIMNGKNVQCPKYTNPRLETLSTKPYSFFQVEGKEEQALCGSYRNLVEAHFVVALIQSLHKASCCDDKKWHAVDKVRIITFYRAQVVLLQQLLNAQGLPKVLVATVDSSQGCEADLVIVSFVRSNNGQSQSKRFAAGFLTDDRRVNVALTRAKFQLICVGNAKAMNTMLPTSTLFGLAANAGERECIVTTTPIPTTVAIPRNERKRRRTCSKNRVTSKRQQKQCSKSHSN